MPGPRAKRRNVGRGLLLSDQLREAIEKSGHSATEVARLAEIDPAQVHRFLSGERDVRLETAGLICEALGLRLAEAARGRARPKMTKTDRDGMSDRRAKQGSEASDGPRETDRPADLDN